MKLVKEMGPALVQIGHAEQAPPIGDTEFVIAVLEERFDDLYEAELARKREELEELEAKARVLRKELNSGDEDRE